MHNYIRSNTFSQPTKPSFPPTKKLTPSAGSKGLADWDKEVLNFAPPRLHDLCGGFINGQPIIPPSKPQEHDIVILTSNKIPQNFIGTPLPTPQHLGPDLDGTPRSSQLGTPISHPRTSTPSPPAQVQSSALNTIERDRYEHDSEGFLTPSGLSRFQHDQEIYDELLLRQATDNSELFTYITHDTYDSHTRELLEADPRWKDIVNLQDCFHLRLAIIEKITPKACIRSLDSLSDLMDCKQGNMPHSTWTSTIQNCMLAFSQDFADSIHPECIDPKKLLSALILRHTNQKDFVKNLLLNTSTDLGSLQPSDLLSDLSNYQRNTNTLSYSSKAATKSTPQSTSNNNISRSNAQAGSHSLSTQYPASNGGLPLHNPSLLTISNPHSRPPGNLTLPTSKPKGKYCTHCYKNGYYFTSHEADKCHDLNSWNKSYGPLKSTQSNHNSAQVQQQNKTTHSLLTQFGAHNIETSNPFEALNTVCAETGTALDSNK